MDRIGIFGGTFNPPHLGHISAARQAVDLLCLDRLILIPDRIAPHKRLPEGSASPEQRFAMLKIAAENYPEIEISDMELRREGISYTYHTIWELQKQYPQAELVLIMGTDMFLSFDTWKNPDIIMNHATLAVLNRGEKGESQSISAKKREMEAKGARVKLMENQILTISSTDLRRMLIFCCANSFLPEGVGDYIHENGLYGVCNDYRQLPMERLEQIVISLLKPDRIPHVLGCRDTAVELARRWGANETDAARAGILHDITKALDGPLQLTLCREYGILLDDFSSRNPKTLHALTGSLIAERVFGENTAVVNAIRHHTTGKANMSLLEKIIYVADYMEPNRDFPGVDRLRQLAYSNIDAALKLGLEMTLELLKKQERDISPESREALAFFNHIF